MINLATITAAVETLLKNNLASYNVNRNAMRATDPQQVARTNGWINVQRGSLSYRAVRTGSQPWQAQVAIRVEVQAASLASGADAEDRLQAAEEAVLAVLAANKKLGNTVDQTLGYDIEYLYNDGQQIWHHAAIITINAEVQA